jgi:pimeloyl-ACP methyl ester carboxylesterase
VPGTIVLIHGAGLTSACWDHVRRHYETLGYRCLAPGWPFEDRPIAELRRAPDPEFGRLTIGRIVQQYERIVRAFPEPPILIGHSFGGLFVQMLLDRGLGAAGVAICPAPCAGIFPGPTTLRSVMPMVARWRSWTRPVMPTFPQFASTSLQWSTATEQRDAYERYVVPITGRIFLQAGLSVGNRIKGGNSKRAPLLLMAGGQDRMVTPRMVEAAYRKQRRSGAPTEYRLYPDRTHLLIATHGWREIADEAIGWAERAVGEERPD